MPFLDTGLLLPPASEGWGKVLFSVCQFTLGGGGTYFPADGGGGGQVPTFQLMEGGGYPYLSADRGYLPWTGGGVGYLPWVKSIPWVGTPCPG